MTYDSRKDLRGQEYVDEIAIEFDCCKYVRNPYLSQRFINGTSSLAPGSLGTLTISGGGTSANALWGAYNGKIYCRKAVSGGLFEIFRITVTSNTTVDVIERGMFGTSQVTITGAIEILHEGEANGSCRGFAQTCSNTDSYSPSEKTVFRFCSAPRTAGSIIFPGLHHKAVDYDSSEVDVGESIGSPAKLRVRLQDFTAGDENVVPYPDKRSSAGTWWGRMLARNPYMNGRKVIWRSGLRDAGTFVDPEWMERHFIIDSCSLSDGHVSLSCLDPVILAEEKKAKMPVVSPAQLAASITGTPTTFDYVNAPDYYFGANGSTIYVRIDSEVIRATVSGPKQLTVSQRGYRSTAKNHEAGATIQDCVRFAGTHIIDAITFAMQSYTSIPAAYIDNYVSVKTKIPTYDLDDCLITKPIPVQDFISAMIKLGNLIFYFNESTLKFVIDYIPELSVQPISINETEHILRESVTVNENTKEQWTRFAHIWAPVDVTSDAEENFAINYLAANLPVESSAKLGEVNEKKTFKNPFLSNSPGDSLIGSAYASRIVSAADRSPRIVTATINAANIGPTQAGDLKIGSVINLVTKEAQDIDGQPSSELYQVLKMTGNAYQNFEVKMRRYLSFQPQDVSFVISQGAINYVLSEHFAPSSPGEYTVYVDVGVEFGSFNTAVAAFSTGPQASGVSIKLLIRGSILGMGGAGGNAGISSTPEQPGLDGGVAFEALCPVVIDTGAGLIWAGGGGGRGEFYIGPQGPGVQLSPRKGGGGGQGYGYSLGGFNTNGASFTDRAAGGSKASPGANGGEWGQPGGSPIAGAPAGQAGIAIKSNGNSVTIIAGNNDFNIRGRRT